MDTTQRAVLRVKNDLVRVKPSEQVLAPSKSSNHAAAVQLCASDYVL